MVIMEIVPVGDCKIYKMEYNKQQEKEPVYFSAKVFKLTDILN